MEALYPLNSPHVVSFNLGPIRRVLERSSKFETASQNVFGVLGLF